MEKKFIRTGGGVPKTAGEKKRKEKKKKRKGKERKDRCMNEKGAGDRRREV